MGIRVATLLLLLWAPLEARADPSCTADGWCRELELPAQHDAARWFGPIWASSERDVWVAGGSGLIARFSEGRWAVVANHAISGIFDLEGSGPNDVYAVGGYRTIQRWDGRAWTRELFDQSRSSRAQFNRIVMIGPGRAIVTGESTWERRDGTWQRVREAEPTRAGASQALAALQGLSVPPDLPRACAQPDYHRLADRWIAICRNRRAFVSRDGDAEWSAWGPRLPASNCSTAPSRMGSRWILGCDTRLFVRDEGAAADAPWAPLPTEGFRPALLHGGRAGVVVDGALLAGDADGNVHRWDGTTWTTEQTNAGGSLNDLVVVGNQIYATSRLWVLRRPLRPRR